MVLIGAKLACYDTNWTYFSDCISLASLFWYELDMVVFANELDEFVLMPVGIALYDAVF